MAYLSSPVAHDPIVQYSTVACLVADSRLIIGQALSFKQAMSVRLIPRHWFVFLTNAFRRSGVEVFGVVAAAVQLVDVGARVLDALSNLYHRIRDQPEKLCERRQNIVQIVEITKTIEASPALHTETIQAVLDASIADARQLFSLLEPLIVTEADTKTVRCWKTVCGLKQEHGILNVLDRLEERRTALILCIGVVNSGLISAVDQNIQDLTSSSQQSFGQIPCIRETVEHITTQMDFLVTSGNIVECPHNATPNTIKTLRAIELALPRLDDRLDEILKLQRSICELSVRRNHRYRSSGVN